MKKDEKKYRRSAVSVVCYVIAALMFGYVCFQIGTTVKTINEYYAQYDMSAQPLEYITYTLQSALQPIVYTIVIFMLGYILDAVRRNNKAYYLTDEEVLEAQEARKQAREAKKFAKGEAAALKAGNATAAEDSVEADFAKSLNEELKADEKKAETRKPRSNNRSGHNRQGGSKSGNGGQRKSGNSSKTNNTNSGSKSGNSGSKSSNGGQHKSSKKPADKPKMKDAARAKADDGFEVKISDNEN
ncbi:MAG: hypothetical protein MJ128_02090 [Mogibacterium sp.]|nr:hypothetical protein [Mogibacterium sp.]